MPLSTLPHELLTETFLNLDVSDFLNLTSTSKQFHSFRNEHSFWRHRVQEDFRLPPQPLFETNGERWHWLYKTLQTQSEVYTWGKDAHGNLGRHQDSESVLQAGYPRPMHGVSGPHGIGKIVDVQCGGWSTVLMNSHGKLFAAGVIDGDRLQWQSHRGSEATIVPVRMPMKPVMRMWMLDISFRTMSAFSMGRKRLLALADHGEVIEWDMNFTVAGSVLSADHLHPDVAYDEQPKARQVVAGWAHGSALYPGHGLYYWSTIRSCECGSELRQPRGTVNLILAGGGDGEHTEHHNDSVCIPGTRSGKKAAPGTLEARIGSVKKYIVLEHHIIILTNTNKLFSWRMADEAWRDQSIQNNEPTELTSFYPKSEKDKVMDIQGSFRTFAVFTSNNGILLGQLEESDLLNTPRFLNDGDDPFAIDLPQPDIRPILQNAGILQLAFGDYHFHALHLNGEVTSYGKESDYEGQLGLGRGPVAMFRGVDWPPRPHNGGNLLLHPKSEGRRRVWFEPEKFAFMISMLDKYEGTMREDAPFQQAVLARPRDVSFAYGEWFEQQGRAWESTAEPPSERGGDGIEAAAEQKHVIPAYYPIRIAAAGWSSAAVVLVDKERAERTRRSYLLPKKAQPVVDEPEQEQQEPQRGSKSESALQMDQNAGGASASAPVSWVEWLGNLSRRLQGVPLHDIGGGAPDQTCEEAEAYVWSEQEFPRLRLPGGNETLLRDGKGAEWKLGEPSWVRG